MILVPNSIVQTLKSAKLDMGLCIKLIYSGIISTRANYVITYYKAKAHGREHDRLLIEVVLLI